MSYTNEKLSKIYDKTTGKCHICCKKLAFINYGLFGERGAWEVEHSRPKAMGGTEHLNNLYPACISCNRSKQTNSTRSSRAQHGRSRAPLSVSRRRQGKNDRAVNGAIFGAAIGGLLLGPLGAAIGASVGAKAEYDRDPDW